MSHISEMNDDIKMTQESVKLWWCSQQKLCDHFTIFRGEDTASLEDIPLKTLNL